MDTPEFDAEMHTEIAQAIAELERLRSSGDEEGARSYESRLAYLRRIAESNGIDLGVPTDRHEAAQPQPEVAEPRAVLDGDS